MGWKGSSTCQAHSRGLLLHVCSYLARRCSAPASAVVNSSTSSNRLARASVSDPSLVTNCPHQPQPVLASGRVATILATYAGGNRL